MTSNNVVKFPNSKPLPDKGVEEFLETNKIRFVDNLVDHYGTQLLSKLAGHGLDIDNKDFLYDYMLTMEALRATLLRNLHVSHPLHSLFNNPESLKYFSQPPDVTKDT